MRKRSNTWKAIQWRALSNSLQKKGNKSKWSSWSLGEISFGDYDKLGFENQKRIKAIGLIFGADRKLGQNKFLGWALRYGNSSSNVKKSVQGVDMESFTLNLYGTIPRDDYRYINTVLGLSVLNFDNKYNGKLSLALVPIWAPFLITFCVTIFTKKSRTGFFITMRFPSAA